MFSDWTINIKRIYEPATVDDGDRILVDRLWPRGISRQNAQIDLWAKGLAPSIELRKWFDHDPKRFEEFASRYRRELDEKPDDLQRLHDLVARVVTLLYAARNADCNHAVVLRGYLQECRDTTRRCS